MDAYYITDWKLLYEVTKDCRRATAATPDDQLRTKEHERVMLPVSGRDWTAAYRQILKSGWKPSENNELAVFGLWCKLLELAADQADPRFRGWILDGRQRPLDAAQIGEMLGVQDIGRLRENLGILIDVVNWVQKRDFELKVSNIAKLRKNAEKCGTFRNEYESESKRKEKKTNQKPKADSDFSIPDDSDSELDRSRFIVALTGIFNMTTGSDDTTFRNIADQIAKTGGNWDRGIELARQAVSTGDKPAAWFTAACKKEFEFKKTVKYVRDKKQGIRKLFAELKEVKK